MVCPKVDSGVFDCERLESWDYGRTLGLFTNLDLDGERTIGFNIASFPGMNAVKAWQVWDYLEAGLGELYMGHGLSRRCLVAFSPFDLAKQADDWLISPEVEGGTELQFFVRPLSYQYGSEAVEVCASSTGTDPGDFALVKRFETAALDPGLTPYWETVSCVLPDDARHFAIRYASKDIFGLQLDDITYAPAQAAAADLVYSVIRDGEVIAEGVAETRYADTYDGQATYYVAAEKKHGGLHPLSNRAEVIPASGVAAVASPVATVAVLPGRVKVAAQSPLRVTVAGVDGRVWHSGLLPAGETSLSLPAGVYVIGLEGQAPTKIVIP